jgi:hypothetical protein
LKRLFAFILLASCARQAPAAGDNLSLSQNAAELARDDARNGAVLTVGTLISGEGACVATLIGRDKLLTAASCLSAFSPTRFYLDRDATYGYPVIAAQRHPSTVNAKPCEEGVSDLAVVWLGEPVPDDVPLWFVAYALMLKPGLDAFSIRYEGDLWNHDQRVDVETMTSATATILRTSSPHAPEPFERGTPYVLGRAIFGIQCGPGTYSVVDWDWSQSLVR